MPLGGLITLAVLLPNVLVLVLPPVGVPPQLGVPDRTMKIMQGIERAGQFTCFLIPFFYPLPALRGSSVDALLLMALALLIYYIGWLRYAFKGHRYVLLFAPLLYIPLPMAVTPVIYFAAAAIFLRSWPLGFAVVLLAVGHLYISQGEWNRCRNYKVLQANG